MELITFAAVSVLSIGLSLAGSRVMLGAVFSFMMRSAVRHDAVRAAHTFAPASE